MTSTGAKQHDRILERAARAFDTGGRSAVRWGFASSLLAGAAVLGAAWLLLDRLGNGAAHFAIQFAGSNDRLSQRLAELSEPVSLADAQMVQLYGGLFAVFWGLVGFVLFAVFWEHCWNAGPAANPALARNIRYIPLAGTAVAILEKIVTLGSLRSAGESVRLVTGTPSAISSIAWAKWVLAAVTLLMVLAMLVSAATAAFQRSIGQAPTAKEVQREVEQQVDDHDLPQLKAEFIRHSRGALSSSEKSKLMAPDGTGVCCSGGGIRAASFALGCLSSLERHPDPDGELKQSILGNAKYLASVSGGGYAAAAWRIAAGTGELPKRPMLGDPTQFASRARRFPSPDEPATNLLEHIRERRTFLANGRGGLPLSVLRFIVQTAWHLGLVFASVYALAWPLGRLIQSWPVNALVIVPGRDAGESSIAFVLRPHQWVPPLVLFAGALLFWLVRLGFRPTRVRLIIDAVIAFFAALAAGAALVLIAVPWLVDVADRIIPNEASGQFAMTGVFAAVGSALWQAAKRYLKSQARYLGGLLLAAGVLLFATTVIKHAVIEQGWLHPLWLWIGVTLGLVGAFITLNPDRWSLHDFYRQRLSGSFVATVAEGRPTPLPESEAPPMSAYTEAEGPKPVVCCAAARQRQTETGVAALSMTFEPGAVTVYHWKPPTDGQERELHPEVISHQEYVRRLPKAQRGRLSTIMGAAAISGAAVAPSMGRKNLKSTNALLAAFNARLGVWVPNPAYPPGDASQSDHDLERMAAPRLVNMFKEIFGVFDLKDPNVYATDGGHWDNLGLVELVRRRCRTIIAIDASGDIPGTYKALKEAMALAKHECDATIEFPPEAWDALTPDDAGLLPRNYVTGTVTYADGETAALLYVKAAVSRSSLLAIQRYAAGDKTFPNYSTVNQMLSDLQMTYLVRLGFESMNFALDDHPDFAARSLV